MENWFVKYNDQGGSRAGSPNNHQIISGFVIGRATIERYVRASYGCLRGIYKIL